MNIFAAVKNEFLFKVSTVENFSKGLTSENYYILTGLSRSDFDNLCSRIRSPALRNT